MNGPQQLLGPCMERGNSMTLVEFLLARIAEDEEVARHGISTQADPETGWGYEGRALTPHVGVIHELQQAEHIMRWHPARVLAECEAKRRIVAAHCVVVATAYVRAPETLSGYVDRLMEVRCATCDPDAQDDLGPCETLRALALPYADNPDYLEKWRP